MIYPIESIEWDDSNSVFRWYTMDDLKTCGLKHITSIGYVIHETVDAVYLAQSDDHDEDDEDRHFNNTMIIAKSAILHRAILMLPAER